MTTKRTPVVRNAKATAKAKAKPKPKSPAPTAPVLDRQGIVLDADPRSVKRAIELTESIERRKKRITEDFYEIGQALIELRDRKLFTKVYGFVSFNEFLTTRGIYSTTQAHKLMAVVAGIPKARALKLGVEKAYQAIALVEATPEENDTAEKIFAGGRKVKGKRPADASAEDFREEARAVRAKERKSKQSRVVVTDAKRERLKARKVGIEVLRKALLALGVPQTCMHEREDEVAVLVPWAMIERVATKASKK